MGLPREVELTKDGGFYYVPVNAEIAALLNKLKPMAKKPVAESN